MDPGLDKKEAGLGLEPSPDLAEESLQAFDLVGRPEDEREIGLDIRPQACVPGKDQADPAVDAGPLRPEPGFFQHLRLPVDSDDQAALAGQAGHGHREETRAAADVQDRVALPDERAQDADGIMEQPPEEVG